MQGLSLKSTWICYARTIAQGNSPDAHAAKLCVRIGGTGPVACERILEHDLRLGRIDAESFRTRVNAVALVTAKRDKMLHGRGVTV